MFTYSRRLIVTVGLALGLSVFSTAVVPTISGDTGQAQAKKKKKKKRVVRTRQS